MSGAHITRAVTPAAGVVREKSVPGTPAPGVVCEKTMPGTPAPGAVREKSVPVAPAAGVVRARKPFLKRTGFRSDALNPICQIGSSHISQVSDEPGPVHRHWSPMSKTPCLIALALMGGCSFSVAEGHSHYPNQEEIASLVVVESPHVDSIGCTPRNRHQRRRV